MGTPRCAFKVDIHKAYDTVDWNFLRLVLHGFGFHERMIAWIMECVTSTSYSICVNGSLHGYFQGKRGLRQGDPLSPYLFTLVMEVLTLMIKRKVQESDLFTYHRFCSKMELINLCFADDLFLFAYGDVQSASVIKEALDEFKQSPRLPVKYLGVPLVSSRLMIRDCNELIDRVQIRIQDWKNKSLSIAGRFQLIQSVLGSMHIYWALVFILPSRVLLNIEQLMRNFLWCHGNGGKGKSKVAWEVKLLTLKESLWVKWIHEYKLNGRNFWDIPLRGNMSWGWRKILKLRPLIREFIWHKIGNGAATSLWYDKWCDLGPLSNHISSRDVFRAGLNLHSKVKEVILNGSWLWPPYLLAKYPFLSECHVPLLDDTPDSLVWRNSQGRIKRFSVTQVWSDIRNRDSKVNCACGMESFPPNVYDVISDLMPIASRRTSKSVVAKLVVAASTYYIWQERNWRLFNKGKRSLDQVCDCIKSSVRLKLLSCRFKKSKSGDKVARLWDLPEVGLFSLVQELEVNVDTGGFFTYVAFGRFCFRDLSPTRVWASQLCLFCERIEKLHLSHWISCVLLLNFISAIELSLSLKKLRIAKVSWQHVTWGEASGGEGKVLSPVFLRIALLCIMSYFSGTESRLRPYHFIYPERSLTMEEMLNKFIDEGKREHEEMRAFIYDFQTNNELLFKERNNSLIELRFGVQELLKVINNVPMINCDVKGVTTRGGKTTTQDVHDNDTNVLPKEPVVVEPEKPVGSNEVLTNDQPQTTSEPVVQPSNETQTPPVPFPRRLRKEKEEAQQKKFLENLKQLHINLPFIEALAQMPKYAKFLKGLLTNKARLEEACKIIMNKRCSAVLLNKLSSKEKDPMSFTIPCDIAHLHINNAFADLGASISLMPYTMYKKLGLGVPKATRTSLELANRSIQYPRGIIENVLIKVDKFVLPIDIVMLDMPEDSRVPIILGSFLVTARAMIDVFNKKITLRVGDDDVIFDVDQSIKRPTTEDDECYGIDDLDETINEEAQELLANEEPGLFLLRGLEKSIDQSDLDCCEFASSDEKNRSDSKNSIRRIDSANTPYPVTQGTTNSDDVKSEHLYSASANEIDEKKPELKNYPQHLEYAYLHGDKSFPIIISFELSKKGKISLLQVLERRKGEIAWKMILPNTNRPGSSRKRLPSPVLMGLLLIDECRLDYVMFLPLFKDAWRLSSTKWWKTLWKFMDDFLPIIFKDAKDYVMRCDACQRSRNISSRSGMPQNNIQTEVTNRAIKHILERSVGYNPKNWSEKLDDTLWAFRTAYEMPTGCTPFRLVYGKACHLPVKIEHKVYWALKQCNMNLTAAAKNHFMELNELIELRDEEYGNTRIYKERTKKWHDSMLRGDKDFKVGDKVLLFNSRFTMHPGKLKSMWYGLNVVKTMHPYGTVEIIDKNGISFKVNGQRLKKYHDGHTNEEEKEVVELDDNTT
ncbi:hypothetical protein Tco_0503876 [Tanacetum coccineum]